MLSVETEIHDEGDCRTVINVTSSRGDLIRSIFKRDDGKVWREWTYEYDAEGRCLAGVVMDGEHNVLSTIENKYTVGGVLYESVERDAVSDSEIYRVLYTLDSDLKIERVEYFELGVKLGYGIPENKDDEYSLYKYFDENGNEVSHIKTRDEF